MGRQTLLKSILLAWLCVALGAVMGCDGTATSGGCFIFDEAVAVGEVVDNLEACLRCTCDGPDQPGCSALPACVRDSGVPLRDRGPSDGGPSDARVSDASGFDASEPPRDQGMSGDGGEGCADHPPRCIDDQTETHCENGRQVVVACLAGERCVLGGCTAPTCVPDSTQCNLGRVLVCDAAGFPVRSEACPSGEVCVEGGCLSAEPNVVLLVDTSGSMASAVQLPERPAPFPACEDAIEPYTRLGVVKLALDRLFASRALDQLRLALVRFPQVLVSNAACPAGHQLATSDLQDLGLDSVPFSDQRFARLRRAMLTVPIERNQSGSDRARLASWVDFGERLEEVGPDCHSECEGVCGAGGVCLDAVDPELRPGGDTPLGRSLAFAGEYLQREIWRDGRPCVESADCDSPHYVCRQQVCTDLLGNCRGQVVVMFTDGGETADPFDSSWYHPSTQARRMAVGLGCSADTDCGRGAGCVAGECTIGRCPMAQVPCHPVDQRCPGNEVCQVLPVRSAGYEAGQRFTNPDGTTHDIQVHVVDVSGAPGNDQIAWWGTGRYLRVAELEADGLVQVFTPLLEAAKDETLRCVVGR